MRPGYQGTWQQYAGDGLIAVICLIYLEPFYPLKKYPECSDLFLNYLNPRHYVLVNKTYSFGLRFIHLLISTR